MEVNDFIGISKFLGFTGPMIGKNKVMSGGIYFPDMSKVDKFDIKDWGVVFDASVVKLININMGYKSTSLPSTKNSIAVGNLTNPTGDSTLQLGWFDHYNVSFNGWYKRADERDMLNKQTITLGLDFILTLDPIKYTAAYREEVLENTLPFPHPVMEPDEPKQEDFISKDAKGRDVLDQASWDEAVNSFTEKMAAYTEYETNVLDIHQQRLGQYPGITNSSPAQQVTHFGFVGEDVESKGSSIDSSFRPLLKHDEFNGYDVNYLDYNQLIAPLVKAVQELHEKHVILEQKHDQLRIEFDELKADHTARIETLETDMALVKTTLGL